MILALKNIATGRDVAEFASLTHVRRPEGGGGGISGTQLYSSILTQGSQTITFLAFDATTSDIVVTSKSMSGSQVVSTTATTFTISVSTTITTTSLSTSTVSPLPASQDEIPLLHDSIIIASVLGAFTILLISGLALTYCIYKRHRHDRELDYSPPFTSLAPPPRSVLSPLTIHSSPIPTEEPRETSLSMGTGIHTSTEPTQRNSIGTSPHQQPRPDRDSTPPLPAMPAIFFQSSSPPSVSSSPNHARTQSRLYHDLLREETAIDAARRQGRRDPPAVPNSLRPVSGLSEISDIDALQMRPSGDNERGRGFPSTRASSGVFPDD